MAHAKTEKYFFAEITKADHQPSKIFILSKYHMFWQNYESFSILCDEKASHFQLKQL